jgi:hypothetical protein
MQQHVYSTNWIGKKWADPKPDQKTPARLSATQMIAPGKVNKTWQTAAEHKTLHRAVQQAARIQQPISPDWAATKQDMLGFPTQRSRRMFIFGLLTSCDASINSLFHSVWFLLSSSAALWGAGP